MMASVSDALQEIGFSQYEAQAYVALLRANPASGYELARASGIPRPNIYPVLQKLEERGAVLRLDTPEGTRYIPADPAELLSRIERQYHSALGEASRALSEITAPAAFENILNLRGYSVMLENARRLLSQANQRLMISLWHDEAVALENQVDEAAGRGVQITTLCLNGCQRPCPACRGEVFRFPIAPSGAHRWLLLSVDGAELLAGEIGQQGQALSVRTRQNMLVNLSTSYIQNSIALASILSSLGDRLDALLDPQIAAAINTLHPFRGDAPWLKTMRDLVRGNNPIEEIKQ